MPQTEFPELKNIIPEIKKLNAIELWKTNKQKNQLKDGSKDIIENAAERDKEMENMEKRLGNTEYSKIIQYKCNWSSRVKGIMGKNQSQSRKWLRIFQL